MRVVLSICLLVPAWLASRRIDRQTLNVLTRRIEAVMKRTDDERTRESCRKCLYHLDAFVARRGRVEADDEIVLDSTDERRLILQAMGLAAKCEARAGFWREKWTAARRWAWTKVKRALWHSAPWAVIGTWLWCSRRRLRRAVWQYDNGVEHLPQEQRLAFRGRDLEREHGRIKRRGV